MLFPAAGLSLLFAQTEGPRVGLEQRLLVTVIALWLILEASRVRAIVAFVVAAGQPIYGKPGRGGYRFVSTRPGPRMARLNRDGSGPGDPGWVPTRRFPEQGPRRSQRRAVAIAT